MGFCTAAIFAQVRVARWGSALRAALAAQMLWVLHAGCQPAGSLTAPRAASLETAQAVYAPSVTTGKVVMRYENAITQLTNSLNQNINQTVYNSTNTSPNTNLNTTLTYDKWLQFNDSLNYTNTQIKSLTKGQSEWRSTPLPATATTQSPCSCRA